MKNSVERHLHGINCRIASVPEKGCYVLEIEKRNSEIRDKDRSEVTRYAVISKGGMFDSYQIIGPGAYPSCSAYQTARPSAHTRSSCFETRAP